MKKMRETFAVATATYLDVSGKTGDHTIMLDKEGMDLNIFGAFETKRDEKVELKLRVVHRVPHTHAHVVLKGVAWDKSSLKLSGTIIVEKLAQQTVSFLKENVLLMSPQARAEAIPNLEIEADDVKCSHAATISKIPEEQIFYLMSRGISRQEAERQIADGFLRLTFTA